MYTSSRAFVEHTRLVMLVCGVLVAEGLVWPAARADSINSPNITLNVDTNRSTGPGAGDAAVTLNTITLAETRVDEYASGDGKRIVLRVRPGFQFDPTSNVTAQSATIGINGAAANTAAVLTPVGTANEALTFNLTSGTSDGQDIMRINGIKLKILSATGAAGPAQTTMETDTFAAGGAFTAQGIVAANITKGAPDRLVFSVQPGSNQAGVDLLPAVTIVDFGGNVVSGDGRTITLAIQENPGAATLLGTAQRTTDNGVAAWPDADDLRITTAGTGYTLRAAHDGAAFLTSDTVDSAPFDITAGDPGQLEITLQPVTTAAGDDIVIEVTAKDEFDNVITATGIDVTLDAAVNPGGWPLLVDTSLTKTTVDGVASWAAADHLRINRAVGDYQLAASGLGNPVLSDAFDITAGPADHLLITQQPTSATAGSDLLVSVTAKDFFENTVTDTPVPVTLGLGVNPTSTALLTSTSLTKITTNGVATWTEADDLRITAAATGYTLRAAHDGNTPLISTTADSEPFDITASAATHLVITRQPVDTSAGGDLLIDVSAQDEFGNVDTAADVDVTLAATVSDDAALLVDTGLTKPTVEGVASWGADDHLRIVQAVSDERLSASGLGDPVLSDAFDITPGALDRLVITLQPDDGAAGEDLLITVAARDSFDNNITNATVPITLSLGTNPSGATLLTSTSLTKETINGVASWNAGDDLRIIVADAGYRISAGSGSIETQSDLFDIVAAAPDQLRFRREPSDTQVDTPIAPAIVVEVDDAFGNKTDASLPVTLLLLTAPCGGAIDNVQANAVNGSATFANVRLDTPCNGDVLAALSEGLVSAVSDPFDITEPPPAPAPVVVCGAGLASTLLPMLLMLTLIRYRYSVGAR